MNRAWILRGMLLVCALGLLACTPKMQERSVPHREEWNRDIPLYGNVEKVTISEYRYSEHVKSDAKEKKIYLFNSDGNVTNVQIEHSGRVTQYEEIEYDENGTKIRKAVCYSDSYKYDIKYRYNRDGRLAEEVYMGLKNEIGKNGLDSRHSYRYDSNGNLIEESMKHYTDYGVDWKIVYRYDSKERLVEQYNYEMDEVERYTLFEYDGNNCISRNEWDGKNRPLAKRLYKYDDTGRKIEESLYNHDGELFSKLSYKYDAQGNMVEFNDSFMTSKRYSYLHKYKYDAMGNMTEDMEYMPDMTPKRVIEYDIEYSK